MRRLLSGLLFLASATGAAVQGDAPPSLQDIRLQLDPQRVRWEAMSLQARKFIFTATTTAELSFLPAERVLPELIEPERGEPVMPQRGVAVLVSTAHFFGRDSTMRLYMSPQTAAAYQYVLDEGGSHAKHRVYRFTDRGVFLHTHKPADEAERERPWRQWRDISTEWRPIEKAARGSTIVDALGLLYVAGAAEFPASGRPLELLSISNRKVARVSLRALPAEPRRVAFDLRTPAGETRCEGMAPAIRVEVDGRPLHPDPDAEGFRFLGLKDDIAIYIEPESRLVLEVRGKAPIVGGLTIRLKEARLHAGGRCPAS